MTQVKAKLNGLRISPRKVRLVAGLIRRRPVAKALDQLAYTAKRSSTPLAKLLESAIANATNNLKLNRDNLFVRDATTWTPWTPGSALPVFATVTAGSGMSEINVITDLDVSGIPGVPVYMGYGTSETDMLVNGKFALIHTFQ